MMEIPQIGEWVFWCDRPYCVQKRQRNRKTGQITLLVCWCGAVECEHPQQHVGLTECEPQPTLLELIADCQQIIQLFPEDCSAEFQRWIRDVFDHQPEQKQQLWSVLSREQREKVRRLMNGLDAWKAA